MEELFGEAFHGPAKKKGNGRERNADPEHDPLAQPANESQHRADPDRCGCGYAADVTVRIVQNDAGAEEADASQDSLNDPAHRVVVRAQGAIRRAKNDDRRDGGAETDERVRAQTGWFAVQFAVQSENGSHDQRGAQAQGGLFVSA